MTTNNMTIKTWLLAALCAGSTAIQANAAIVNGNFETGTLAAWVLVGSGQAATSGIGVTPTEGSFQGYIETTGNFTAPAATVAGSLLVSGPSIAALGAGVPTNGTGIWQNTTVTAGDTLTFDWNFLTDELDQAATYNDFAFFAIQGTAYLLASRNSSVYNMVSPPSGFDGQTGWATQSYTFPASGTFKVGFGVFNVGDSGHNSVLLLDAISIAVPEPASVSLLAVGLVAIIVRRRRVRSSAC